MIKQILSIIVTVAAVVVLSYYSMILWGGKPETVEGTADIKLTDTMTASEIIEAYSLPDEVVLKALGTENKDISLSELGLNTGKVAENIKKNIAIEKEHQSKNWVKIASKFAVWIIFMTVIFVYMRKWKISRKAGIYFYLASIFIFGIVLGSDPSPMGTVKDAVVLFGRDKVIFPPRMIAFTVFILMVVVANKFVCSWGCQFGVLQDYLFRISIGFKKFKVPFAVTNTVRILFLVLIAVFAFVSGTDIVEPIDPFKIFNPAVLLVSGIVFIVVMLIASLFVYRPWCHFLCPFGIAGWFFEKLSFFKIKVDYGKCIACGTCEKECPSTVMGAILKRDRIIPDCFSCGTCIEKCPVKAISFDKGKRQLPPEGKFMK